MVLVGLKVKQIHFVFGEEQFWLCFSKVREWLEAIVEIWNPFSQSLWFWHGLQNCCWTPQKDSHQSFIDNCLWNQQKYRLWVNLSSPFLSYVSPLLARPSGEIFSPMMVHSGVLKAEHSVWLLARAVQFLLWLMLCEACFLIQIRNCSNRIAVITSVRWLLMLKIL